MSRDADKSELTVHLRIMTLACMSQPRALQCKGRLHGTNAWRTFDAAHFYRLLVMEVDKPMDSMKNIGGEVTDHQHGASVYHLTQS